MKKLFLIGAMLMACNFANAADVEEKGEIKSSSLEEISVAKKVVVEDVECFQLSCGVACTSDGPVEYESDCDVECFFDDLELYFCQ